MNIELNEASAIAEKLTQRKKDAAAQAEKEYGQAARLHFKPLQEKLANALAECRKIQGDANRAREIADKVLMSGVTLHPGQRQALLFARENLRAGGAIHGLEWAIEKLDELGDDSAILAVRNALCR